MIKVLSAFHITIQDLGRFAYRSMGVPISGVMDSYSAILANLILNNKENDAVLEITFGACQLQFESDCTICLTGANFSAKIDGEFVNLNTAITIKKNAILSFGKRIYGVRTYLSITEGFQTDSMLGSRSMYKGITPNSIIKKGTVLPIILDQKTRTKSYSSVKINPTNFNAEFIACYEGPEFYLLAEKQKKQLLDTLFTISSDNGRMGYKLEEPITNNFASMLTSAVLPGTVQITPSGKLIVLMKDCQATGGYPRVLQITENAINQLAQKTTGDQFRFKTVAY